MERLRVFGLSRLDSLDLKKRFPDASITFEPGATRDPQHGELATAAVVGLTTGGVQAVAAWLLKNQQGRRIEKTIEIVDASGTTRTARVIVDVSGDTTEADVAQVIEKLTAR